MYAPRGPLGPRVQLSSGVLAGLACRTWYPTVNCRLPRPVDPSGLITTTGVKLAHSFAWSSRPCCWVASMTRAAARSLLRKAPLRWDHGTAEVEIGCRTSAHHHGLGAPRGRARSKTTTRLSKTRSTKPPLQRRMTLEVAERHIEGPNTYAELQGVRVNGNWRRGRRRRPA